MRVQVKFHEGGRLVTEYHELTSWERLPALGSSERSILGATLVDERVLLSDVTIIESVYSPASSTTDRLFQRLHANSIVQHVAATIPSEFLLAYLNRQLKTVETGKRLESEPEVLAAIVALSLDSKHYLYLEEIAELKIAELGAIPRLAKFCLRPVSSRLGKYASFFAEMDEHEAGAQ